MYVEQSTACKKIQNFDPHDDEDDNDDNDELFLWYG